MQIKQSTVVVLFTGYAISKLAPAVVVGGCGGWRVFCELLQGLFVLVFTIDIVCLFIYFNRLDALTARVVVLQKFQRKLGNCFCTKQIFRIRD